MQAGRLLIDAFLCPTAVFFLCLKIPEDTFVNSDRFLIPSHFLGVESEIFSVETLPSIHFVLPQPIMNQTILT